MILYFCKLCEYSKPDTEFYVYQSRTCCKACYSWKSSIYSFTRKEQIRITKKKYTNRPEVKQRKQEYDKEYRKLNMQRRSAQIKLWGIRNRDRLRQKYADRLKNNPQVKLRHTLRVRINKSLSRSGVRKTRSPIKDLGCTVLELKAYLESKFQPGMDWTNHSRKGWHVDHIKPLASFDLSDPEQFKAACHYTNLQPLWAFDNLSKGRKEIA